LYTHTTTTQPNTLSYTTLFRSDAALEEKLSRFLDRRRLITTRLGFITPTLVPLTIDASVVASTGRSLGEMNAVVESALRGFFHLDRKSTRLNSSHQIISYAVFC